MRHIDGIAGESGGVGEWRKGELEPSRSQVSSFGESEGVRLNVRMTGDEEGSGRSRVRSVRLGGFVGANDPSVSVSSWGTCKTAGARDGVETREASLERGGRPGNRGYSAVDAARDRDLVCVRPAESALGKVSERGRTWRGSMDRRRDIWRVARVGAASLDGLSSLEGKGWHGNRGAELSPDMSV